MTRLCASLAVVLIVACAGCQSPLCFTSPCQTQFICGDPYWKYTVEKDVRLVEPRRPERTAFRETFVSDTLSYGDINIQNVKGLNAKLLADAIQTALRLIDLQPESIGTSGDTVIILTAPKRVGNIAYTHHIVAVIESASKKISLRLGTSGKHASGERGRIVINEAVPSKVLMQLKQELKKGNADNTL